MTMMVCRIKNISTPRKIADNKISKQQIATMLLKANEPLNKGCNTRCTQSLEAVGVGMVVWVTCC
jgi:hypothetical protein